MRAIVFTVILWTVFLSKISLAQNNQNWAMLGGCAGAAAMGSELQQDPSLKQNLIRRVVVLRQNAQAAGRQAFSDFEKGMNYEINQIKGILNSRGRSAAYAEVDQALWGLCPR